MLYKELICLNFQSFFFPIFVFSSTLGLNDFKSSFVQTITTPKHKKITYSGIVKFSKKTMKWEYKKTY